jgi:FeS assembly SUF system protein
MMADDIEDLKVHKIVRREDGRVSLGVYGQVEPTEEVREAFGGSGEAPAGPVDREGLRERIVETLKSIHDPEIPVNIYDLGLIYGFEIADDGSVEIEMTLTAPACPVAGTIVQEVAKKTGEIDGVSRSHVTLTWDPPWTRERMTEEALLELGLL